MPPETVYDPPPYSWTRVRTLNGGGVRSAIVPSSAEADEHAAAALGWARLEPVRLVAVEPRFGECR